MNLKIIKAAFAGLMLSVSCFANSGIIDNESYTTVDGIDWLDFTATINMTQTEALAANQGWRAATLAESLRLMDTMYGHKLIYDDNGRSEWGLLIDGSASTNMFKALFGNTNGRGFSHASLEGIGSISVSRRYATVGGGRTYGWHDVDFRSEYAGIALVRSVPEPSTLAIFALGIMGLGFRRIKNQ